MSRQKSRLKRLFYAKRLLQTPTFYEIKLGNFLTQHKIAFQSQKLIKRWIVDFCLPSYQLIIEADGCQHNSGFQHQRDLIRDSWLWRNGYKVIRLKNPDILDDLKVIAALKPYIKQLAVPTIS